MKIKNRIKGLAALPHDRILPCPLNWRLHPDNQKEALRGLLADVGVIDTILVRPVEPEALATLRKVGRSDRAAFDAWLAGYRGDFMLIDGHLRVEELQAHGPIDALVVDLDEREAAEALATFDPIGDLATMDRGKFLDLAGDFNSTNAAVQALVADLAKVDAGAPPDFGLEGDGATGGSEEGSGATGGEPAGEDEEPVIPTDALIAKWGTAPGQLWVVPSLTVPGREHRLLCGDCRDPANVERLRAGRRPKLGLHDPPYGIAIVAGGRRSTGKVGGDKAFGTVGQGKIVKANVYAVVHDDDKPFDPAHLLDSAKVLVLWGANNYADRLPPSAGAIVWDKRVDMAENDFSDGELAWVSPKASGRLRMIRHVWNGLIKASERGEKRLHPTQKPVIVQGQIVQWYSEPGDDVEDWYMGAGAVIIACEQTGRIGHGMDIAHAYLAATLERLSQRGLTPRLAA